MQTVCTVAGLIFCGIVLWVGIFRPRNNKSGNVEKNANSVSTKDNTTEEKK